MKYSILQSNLRVRYHQYPISKSETEYCDVTNIRFRYLLKHMYPIPNNILTNTMNIEIEIIFLWKWYGIRIFISTGWIVFWIMISALFFVGMVRRIRCTISTCIWCDEMEYAPLTMASSTLFRWIEKSAYILCIAFIILSMIY